MSNKSRAQRPQPKKRKTAAGFEPIRINTTDERPEVKRVPLFYIDEEEYTIPEKFPASLGLRYLRNLNVDGRDYAVAQLMEEALGADGFEALSNCDSLTKEQMDQINELIIELAMGAAEEGN